MKDDKPVTIAVNTKLQDELKIRQKEILQETGRRMRGGITSISEVAALELSLIRQSGYMISKHIEKEFRNIQFIQKEGIDYVPFFLYKKLYILMSILNKKKDENQIILQIFKPRGSKKNVHKVLW